MNIFKELKINQGKIVKGMLLGGLLGLVWGAVGVVDTRAAGVARVWLTPTAVSVPPTGVMSLRVDAGSAPVGFVQVEVDFDPGLINLEREPVLSGPLTTVVSNTATEEANLSGKWVAAVGLSPQNRDNPPSGEFEVAQLSWRGVISEVNQTATVTVNSEATQVVGMDTEELAVSAETAVVNINVVVPTMTPVPTGVVSTPTPTPTRGAGRLTARTDGSPVVGEEWPVRVEVVAEEEISGVDVVMRYDPRKLTALRWEDAGLVGGESNWEVNNGNGVVRVSQNMPVGAGWQGEGSVGQVVFKPLAAGEVEVSFEYLAGSKSESNMIALADGRDILEQAEGVTATVWDPVWLKLVLETDAASSEEGRAATGSMQLVDGSWQSDFATNAWGESELMAGKSEWIGQVTTWWIKVSGYLRRRVEMVVSGGVNEVGVGKLTAGDMNDDGIINNVDLALMYADWFGSGMGDYNGDGIVNSADHWILTHNFLATDE